MQAFVDGVSVYNSSSFTWDGNNGSLYMELETLENTRIDNLAISIVPEPSTALLAGLCAGSLMLRRRRS
jgi:hypothetical protein